MLFKFFATPPLTPPRYIPPKSSQAWLLRCVYKNKQHTHTDGHSYVLNDTDAFVTNSKDGKTCSIVKSPSVKSWPAARAHLEKLVAAAEKNLNVIFKMLAADFVSDADDNWWLVQVKAFELLPALKKGEQQSVKGGAGTKVGGGRGGKCKGAYCHEVLEGEDLLLYPGYKATDRHKMTYKDMLRDRLLQKDLEASAKRALAQENRKKEKEKEREMLLGMGLHEELKELQLARDKDEEEEAAAEKEGGGLQGAIGVDVFTLEKRLLDSLGKRDQMKLYDEVQVCPSCHNRYVSLGEQRC
jgi:hypothetical protein